jgi:hypothetical protein
MVLASGLRVSANRANEVPSVPCDFYGEIRAMSNRLIRTLLLAAVSGYMFTPSSFGCQCIEQGDALSEAKKAQAVFARTVTSLSTRGDFVEVCVHVIEKFKGAFENGSDIEIETPSGGPACGFACSNGRT